MPRTTATSRPSWSRSGPDDAADAIHFRAIDIGGQIDAV